MNNYGHLVFAAIVGGAATLAYNALRALPGAGLAFLPPVALDFTLVTVIALGAMLPDVDHPQSKIFKFTLAVVFISAAWLALPWLNGNYLAALGAGFIAALAAFLFKPRHRGVTHSAKLALAYGIACFALTSNAGLGWVGLAAYASHLIADA